MHDVLPCHPEPTAADMPWESVCRWISAPALVTPHSDSELGIHPPGAALHRKPSSRNGHCHAQQQDSRVSFSRQLVLVRISQHRPEVLLQPPYQECDAASRSKIGWLVEGPCSERHTLSLSNQNSRSLAIIQLTFSGSLCERAQGFTALAMDDPEVATPYLSLGDEAREVVQTPPTETTPPWYYRSLPQWAEVANPSPAFREPRAVTRNALGLVELPPWPVSQATTARPPRMLQ